MKPYLILKYLNNLYIQGNVNKNTLKIETDIYISKYGKHEF